DNNGLTIELVVDKFDIPDERRGEVLALAHQKRVADGSEYVDDEHMLAALEELGLEAKINEVPDAPTGSGIQD
ncbi:MAG: VOC family protein, partial [Halobacteria archaeon]|nr:VOC family protein [Halobacteria archaeon]